MNNNTWSQSQYPVYDLPLQIYTTLLIVVGVPGNIVGGYLMRADKTTRKSTRFLIGVIALADVAVLMTAVTRYWMLVILHWDPRNLGEILCRLHVFAVAFSTDFAVGSLCALAIERFLLVAYPFRAKTLVTIPSIVVALTIFGFVLALKNGIHFWIMGEWSHVNKKQTNFTHIENSSLENTANFACVSNTEYIFTSRIFMKLDFISFAILPYVILFFCNIYIYCVLRRQRMNLNLDHKLSKRRSEIEQDLNSTICGRKISKDKQEKLPQTIFRFSKHSILKLSIDQQHEESLNASELQKIARKRRKPEDVFKILTALTVVHIACTLPGTIFTLLSTYFFLFDNMEKKKHQFIKFFLVLLIFTNNAINFFAYFASSERFRMRVFAWCKIKNEVATSVDGRNSNAD